MNLPSHLSTARLRLVPASPAWLDLLIQGPDAFAAVTGLHLAEGYLEFPEALDYTRQQLLAAGDLAPWWTPWLFVLEAEPLVVGLGGFKGPPDPDGVVEFGYGTAFAWRNRGLATEAARALVDHAFRQPEITAVRAHTLPEFNASTRILQKCGLRHVAEIDDPTDGRIWRWELSRTEATSSTPSGPKIAVPILESDDLRLRPYRMDDLPAFLVLNQDEAVRVHLGGPLGKFDAARHLEHFVGDGCSPGNEAWAVTDLETGEYLGHAWLHRESPEEPPELGYLIDHERWGHGLGTQVARLVVRYALHQAGYPVVQATVDADNPASIKVLERAGMRRLGEARDPDGTYFTYEARSSS